MKIFTAAQIHELDRYTIEHEPVASIDLMERAAREMARAIMDEWTPQTPVVVLAGPGNNGGDGLAVARLLGEAGYRVRAFLFNVRQQLSPDCETNKHRLLESKRGEELTEVTSHFDPPELTGEMLVVDALFGSGLNKPLTGGFASLVKYVNQSAAQVVSLDVPSGLMCEDNTQNIKSHIIHAQLTLTLQQRKLSMLLADSEPFVGRLRVLDIRLSAEGMERLATPFTLVEEYQVRRLLQPRSSFAHKGTMGTALLVAGSYGMAGAAILASRACLRSGVGKVVTHTPRANYTVMQVAVPEAVLQLDRENNAFSDSVNTDHCDALGIGPGLGQDETTAIALIGQLRRTQCPIVADADALNILASHQAWLQQLPRGVILTPHAKEMDRLSGSPASSHYERLTRAMEMAHRLQCYVLLKGHHSALCTPGGQVFFNTTGNAGMATAGCGDVLTGIITALLARGYSRQDACLLGMYLHGLAGDLAARQVGQESLTASDVVNHLPQAFLRLEA